MKKNTMLFIILAVAVIAIGLVILKYVIERENCQDIIGDGWAMGTDKYPEVIGNTCD